MASWKLCFSWCILWWLLDPFLEACLNHTQVNCDNKLSRVLFDERKKSFILSLHYSSFNVCVTAAGSCLWDEGQAWHFSFGTRFHEACTPIVVVWFGKKLYGEHSPLTTLIRSLRLRGICGVGLCFLDLSHVVPCDSHCTFVICVILASPILQYHNIHVPLCCMIA